MERLFGYALPFESFTSGNYVTDSEGRTVAYFGGDMGCSDDDRRGIAKLFSASPEMADALKDAAELAEACAIDTTGTPSAAFFAERATLYRAALAKAAVA